jgi:fatty acid desaturase
MSDMDNNLTETLPLTKSDIYATDKAFDQATDWWELVRVSTTVGQRIVQVLLFLVVCLPFFAILGFRDNWSIYLLSFFIALPTLFVLMSFTYVLIRRKYKNEQDARKIEIGIPIEGFLKFSELQSAIFRKSLPKHVMVSNNFERLKKLFEARVEKPETLTNLIASHPLVTFIVALILAGVSGLASQSDIRPFFIVFVLMLVVLLFVITQLFPDLIIGKSRRNRKLLDFLKELEFESKISIPETSNK